MSMSSVRSVRQRGVRAGSATFMSVLHMYSSHSVQVAQIHALIDLGHATCEPMVDVGLPNDRTEHELELFGTDAIEAASQSRDRSVQALIMLNTF